MHVTQEDLQRLFGAEASLTVYRWLYQPGEYAAEQTVTIIGPRRRVIDRVRILGPMRQYSQIELALTDGIALGIDLPVRRSADLPGTPGCVVMGPAGVLEMKQALFPARQAPPTPPAY